MEEIKMKIKKQYICYAILLLGVSILVSCSKQKSETSQKKIGIIQIMEHDCLDASRKGFVDGLREYGYEDGVNINIDYKNAQNDQTVCNSIANSFVQEKKDLVLAISTPAAQSISNATSEIPILINSVTDNKSSGLDRSNITGTLDVVPVEKQIKLIKSLLPNTKKIGAVYCSSEVNSKYQVEMAKIEAQKLDMTVQDYTVSNSNEIQQVVEQAVKSVDVLFVPTDNLVVSCMPVVSQIANSNKVPIICSETASLKNGALATYGVDYYEIGKFNAKQAVEILNNNKKISEIPIESPKDVKLAINNDAMESLGIKIPDELKGELQ